VKQLSKLLLYPLLLVAVGVLLFILNQPGSPIEFEAMPSAEGHVSNFMHRKIETGRWPAVASPEPSVQTDAREQVVEETSSGHAEEPQALEAALPSSEDLGPLKATFGWHIPEDGFTIEDIPATKASAMFLERMEELDFHSETESTYLGKNDEGLDNSVFIGEGKEDVMQWSRGSTLVVETIGFLNGTKLIRRPVSDGDFKRETDYSEPDGTYRRVVRYDSGEVESLQIGNGKYESLYRYDRSGRLVEYYHGLR